MVREQCVLVKFTQESLGALCAALVVHAERLNSLLEPSWPNAEKVHEEMYDMGRYVDDSCGRPEMV
jgi:hypothetical protein